MVSAATDIETSGILNEFFRTEVFMGRSENVDLLFREDERFSAS
jgi:hypothetical protein